MSVVVKQINLTVREVTESTVSPLEISPCGSSSNKSYDKVFWLDMSVLFDYDSYLGDRVSGTASDQFYKITTAHYDESGNCGDITIAELPDKDTIVSYAQSLAEEKAQSDINEEILHSGVESFYRKVQAYDLPDIFDKKTGLQVVNSEVEEMIQ